MTLLTEEDAKTRWCPLARAVVGGPRYQMAASGNRGDPLPDFQGHVLCIASACMMWRGGFVDGNDTPKGYCGMAPLASAEP